MNMSTECGDRVQSPKQCLGEKLEREELIDTAWVRTYPTALAARGMLHPWRAWWEGRHLGRRHCPCGCFSLQTQ